MKGDITELGAESRIEVALDYVELALRLWEFFFVSSRRRHTILVSDWSSDVCSSDLMIRHVFLYLLGRQGVLHHRSVRGRSDVRERRRFMHRHVPDDDHKERFRRGRHAVSSRDWKSGVEGKRVELRGRRVI